MTLNFSGGFAFYYFDELGVGFDVEDDFDLF
jgi:hypothetical protein